MQERAVELLKLTAIGRMGGEFGGINLVVLYNDVV